MAGTIVANTINTDTGIYQTNNAYNGIAKAWARFNGVSGVTIDSSFNISSITRSSTGIYVVNFTTAMSASTYSVSGGASSNGSTGGTVFQPFSSGGSSVAPSTSAFTCQVNVPTVGTVDSPYISFSVFSA
jgi:hypothetical protein